MAAGGYKVRMPAASPDGLAEIIGPDGKVLEGVERATLELNPWTGATLTIRTRDVDECSAEGVLRYEAIDPLTAEEKFLKRVEYTDGTGFDVTEGGIVPFGAPSHKMRERHEGTEPAERGAWIKRLCAALGGARRLGAG